MAQKQVPINGGKTPAASGHKLKTSTNKNKLATTGHWLTNKFRQTKKESAASGDMLIKNFSKVTLRKLSIGSETKCDKQRKTLAASGHMFYKKLKENPATGYGLR